MHPQLLILYPNHEILLACSLGFHDRVTVNIPQERAQTLIFFELWHCLFNLNVDIVSLLTLIESVVDPSIVDLHQLFKELLDLLALLCSFFEPDSSYEGQEVDTLLLNWSAACLVKQSFEKEWVAHA